MLPSSGTRHDWKAFFIKLDNKYDELEFMTLSLYVTVGPSLESLQLNIELLL